MLATGQLTGRLSRGEVFAEARRRGIRPKVVTEHSRELTFVEFCQKVNPGFIWYQFDLDVAAELQKVADGKIKRLAIFCPPRHGKTELVSRMFSAYWLYRFPQQFVGLCSYAADLAHDLSLSAQEYYTASGRALHPKRRKRNHWATVLGGGMWAAGVGGPITGKGFHLGIIDDPLKNDEEANSATIREKQKSWYGSTFYTRCEPDAAIIVVMTRWHEDDLAGHILAHEFTAEIPGADVIPECWRVLNYPAIRETPEEEAKVKWPRTISLAPDQRKPGEALCPGRKSLAALLRSKAVMGAYWWQALFMQQPTTPGGSILKRSYFPYRIDVRDVPTMVQMVMGVDLAFEEKTTADFTVGYPLGRDLNGRYYLFRPYVAQHDEDVVLQGIAARARETGCKRVGVEKVAAQSAYVRMLRRRPEMAGIVVIGVVPDKDKEARARGWAPIAEQYLITLVTDGTGWEERFLKQAEAFPRAKNDDEVDAVGLAIETMRTTGTFRAATSNSKSDRYSNVLSRIKG